MRRLLHEEGRLESCTITQPSHSFPSPREEPPHNGVTHSDFRAPMQRSKLKVPASRQCHSRARLPAEPLCAPLLLNASCTPQGSLTHSALRMWNKYKVWRGTGFKCHHRTEPCCSGKGSVWIQQPTDQQLLWQRYNQEGFIHGSQLCSSQVLTEQQVTPPVWISS